MSRRRKPRIRTREPLTAENVSGMKTWVKIVLVILIVALIAGRIIFR